MTSVDSGVETSNDSNDSSNTHESRPIEITLSPSPAVVITPSVEDSSAIQTIRCLVPTSLARSLAIEPPAGISFCNIQPLCAFGKGYEVRDEVVKSFPLSVYQPTDLQRKFRAHYSRHSRAPYLRIKALLDNPHDTRRSVSRRAPTIMSCVMFLDERKLRHAASTNNEEQVAVLLNAGVDPNSHDSQWRTPLHLAACRGYSKIVQLLLDKGANPNQKDTLGNTPLHLAACTNHVEVVTALLKAGTDVNSNDSYGRNPLQLAQSKLKLLQRSGQDDDSLRVKNEVLKVIEMMFTFLHKKGQDSEAELLNAFQTRLTLSQTKEEVETDVRDLLDSLNNLSLKSETD